jgi:glutamyl/glutaminyl-tRNA synthetase
MKLLLTKKPCRLAVIGNPHGPSLYHLLEVLGKEKSLARIERSLTKIG